MDTMHSRLLTLAYELEGLLLVVEKHDTETPAVVYQRIGELGQQIAQLAQQFSSREPSQPAPTPQTSSSLDAPSSPPASKDAVDAPILPQRDDLPEKDYDADETWQHDNGEEFDEVFKIDNYTETRIATPAAEPTEATQAAAESPAQVEGDTSLRVDEQLHRSLSKDMRKALSLNDRFRFKRELFGNSDIKLDQALDRIDAMQSFDQAQAYFIDTLGWDADNENVADFMGLVRRHFL